MKTIEEKAQKIIVEVEQEIRDLGFEKHMPIIKHMIKKRMIGLRNEELIESHLLALEIAITKDIENRLDNHLKVIKETVFK